MAPHSLKPQLNGNLTQKICNGSNNGHIPNSVSESTLIHQIDTSSTNGKIETLSSEPFRPQIKWPDLMAQLAIHVGFLYGLYYLVTFKAKLFTYIWCKFLFSSLITNSYDK